MTERFVCSGESALVGVAPRSLRDYTAGMSRFAKWCVGLLTVVVLALAAVEWHRPRAPTAVPAAVQQPPAPIDDRLGRFQHPAEFDELCQRLRQRYLAMDERYRKLTHTQVRVSKELDADGNAVAVQESVEQVSFEDGLERRAPLREHDQAADAAERDLPRSSSAVRQSQWRYPFSKDDVGGLYQYQWLGTRLIDDVPTVEVGYRPAEPRSDLLAGTVCVNPETGEPVRFTAHMVKPPAFVDRFDMIVDYGRAENGEIQIRRFVTDGSGGFSFIRKHYYVETEFRDYR
jgi:hypothetical protein